MHNLNSTYKIIQIQVNTYNNHTNLYSTLFTTYKHIYIYIYIYIKHIHAYMTTYTELHKTCQNL